MKTKAIEKAGISLPELGFGTWGMGGKMKKIKNYDKTKDIEAIQYAIDNGITHFDTAELYAEGLSESILAQAIQGYERKKLFLASKVSGDNCTYKQIKKSCEASLQRLGIDYLDLYYIHWIEEGMNLKKVMQALDELVEAGYIKYIGVSNFSVEALKKAQEYSKYPISVNQVHYSLTHREPEKELLQYCQDNDILVVAWRPVLYGDIPDSLPTIMEEMVTKYNKTPAQICINFLTSQKNVVTIFKSSTFKYIIENIGGVGWEMESEDIEKLRSNFPNITYESDVPFGTLDEIVDGDEEPLD